MRKQTRLKKHFSLLDHLLVDFLREKLWQSFVSSTKHLRWSERVKNPVLGESSWIQILIDIYVDH